MLLNKLVLAIFKTLIDLILLPFKIFWKKRKKKVSSSTHKLHEEEWVEINTNLKSDSNIVLKQTLILADKSLENILKDLTIGETMGERLISAKGRFSNNTYNAVWSAHKIRNSLVHETGYEPNAYVLKSAINDLKKGVKELGVKA
jgi:hypothetical protein